MQPELVAELPERGVVPAAAVALHVFVRWTGRSSGRRARGALIWAYEREDKG